MFSIFSYAYWPFVYLLWKTVCSSPLPMFSSGCIAFVVELWELFISSVYECIIRCVIRKCFLPFCGIAFSLCCFLWRSVLKFDVVPFVHFFAFIACAFGAISKEVLPNATSKLSPTLSSGSFIAFGPVWVFHSLWVNVCIWCEVRLFYVNIQVPQHHLWKRVSFFHCVVLVPLSMLSSDHMPESLFLGSFVPLVCISAFRPASHCFNYDSFVICFEVRKHETFVLSFQHCLAIWDSLKFRMRQPEHLMLRRNIRFLDVISLVVQIINCKILSSPWPGSSVG